MLVKQNIGFWQRDRNTWAIHEKSPDSCRSMESKNFFFEENFFFFLRSVFKKIWAIQNQKFFKPLKWTKIYRNCFGNRTFGHFFLKFPNPALRSVIYLDARQVTCDPNAHQLEIFQQISLQWVPLNSVFSKNEIMWSSDMLPFFSENGFQIALNC